MVAKGFSWFADDNKKKPYPEDMLWKEEMRDRGTQRKEDIKSYAEDVMWNKHITCTSSALFMQTKMI